jgi:hypothetical protein
MRFRCANRILRLPWLGMGHGLGEPQGELPIRTGVAIDKVAKRFRNVVIIDIAASLDFEGDIS